MTIEYDHMHVIGHNDISIDPQTFFLNAVYQAVHNNLDGFRSNENWKPICDCESNIISKYPIYEMVAIHELII